MVLFHLNKLFNCYTCIQVLILMTTMYVNASKRKMLDKQTILKQMVELADEMHLEPVSFKNVKASLYTNAFLSHQLASYIDQYNSLSTLEYLNLLLNFPLDSEYTEIRIPTYVRTSSYVKIKPKKIHTNRKSQKHKRPNQNVQISRRIGSNELKNNQKLQIPTCEQQGTCVQETYKYSSEYDHFPEESDFFPGTEVVDDSWALERPVQVQHFHPPSHPPQDLGHLKKAQLEELLSAIKIGHLLVKKKFTIHLLLMGIKLLLKKIVPLMLHYKKAAFKCFIIAIPLDLLLIPLGILTGLNPLLLPLAPLSMIIIGISKLFASTICFLLAM